MMYRVYFSCAWDLDAPVEHYDFNHPEEAEEACARMPGTLPVVEVIEPAPEELAATA
jgi:hypothetical protein